VENCREIIRSAEKLIFPEIFCGTGKNIFTHNRHQSTKTVYLAASCITNLCVFLCLGVA